VGEAREMVARLFDLSRTVGLPPYSPWQLLWPESAPASGGGKRFKRYKQAFAHGYYALARSSGFGAGAIKMLVHYELHPLSNVAGRRSDVLADELLKHMRAMEWP